jgi:hypothetical protein
MLPDGPDRDDPIASSSGDSGAQQLDFATNLAFARPVKVFRDAAEENATQMHIWPDGTREEMTMCVANHTEVRGWFAARGNEAALQWPLVARADHEPVLNGDTVVVKTRGWVPFLSTDQPAKEFFEAMTDPRSVHMGKLTVSFGDVVAYKKHVELRRVSNSEWKEQVFHLPIHFLFLDAAHETVILRTAYSDVPQVEEIPINKFFADFPLSSQFAPKLVRIHNEPPREVVTPLPMAYSVPAVVKALLKFRRLHLKAQERKFAPGGLGFKRALETETAQAMKRPCLDAAVTTGDEPAAVNTEWL